MHAKLACLAAFALLIGGCSRAASIERPDPIIVATVIKGAADQIKRCYQRPAVRHEVRQIITRLRVRYAADGSLIGLPEVVAQAGVTPETSGGASKMAQAAVMAVMSCAPLRLPAESYRGGWDEMDLIFSPAARG